MIAKSPIVIRTFFSSLGAGSATSFASRHIGAATLTEAQGVAAVQQQHEQPLVGEVVTIWFGSQVENLCVPPSLPKRITFFVNDEVP